MVAQKLAKNVVQNGSSIRQLKMVAQKYAQKVAQKVAPTVAQNGSSKW